MSRKLIFALLTATLLLAAHAGEIRLPEGFSRIESEAFFSVSGVDGIYIPPSCSYVSGDAFCTDSLTVYGYRDTAAESYALETGYDFVDVGVYDIGFSCPERLYSGVPFPLEFTCRSAYGAKLTDVTFSPVCEPEYTGDSLIRIDVPGSYTLSLTYENEYTRITRTFPDVLVIRDTEAINLPVVSLSLGSDRIYLDPGQNLSLPLTVVPETDAVILWSSSDTDKLTVDENGVITGLVSGTARVTATLAGREDISAFVDVNILSSERQLVMPLRRTDIDGISANRARIRSVRQSAVTQLRSLYARGLISEEVMDARMGVIGAAFDSYDFPWMTQELQIYWNEANSQNGAKYFYPGTVYYGLPYISGEFLSNRLYNKYRAVSEGFFTENGDHYLLNREQTVSGLYVGSDCSSFVGSCYYGNLRVLMNVNTHYLATTDDFKTLSRTDELYPGDILVRNYAHVVIFLYYADDAHTQIVLIEQGGDEAAINTISVNTRPLSYYYERGFVPRRYYPWK